ncbi:hypothetical protein L3X38_011596 [Prunus dulcis]|uniref:Uncharacterized protein n=1 Tax=Prunus dulcis TaxID=3755 RepID=A0AAD4ZF76_PRUDU|nr:hypothetical protein L3X38_011596 [Prunus dulcis]
MLSLCVVVKGCFICRGNKELGPRQAGTLVNQRFKGVFFVVQIADSVADQAREFISHRCHIRKLVIVISVC